MDLANLNRFKKLFESQINATVASATESSVPDASEPCDDLDRAALIQEQLLSDAFQARKVISVQKAKDALNRIRMGTFGICLDCDEEIDLRRLEIHPTTPLCIYCQEEHEYSLKIAI